MFKIIVTVKNHRTGQTTVETCSRRYKTFRGAEKAAQGMRWVCRPDGVTATEEVSAEVVEVSTTINLQAHYDAEDRINAVIGNPNAPTPNTTENLSRDRLMRVSAGLLHMLDEVIPRITDAQQRQEVYLWVDGMYTITQCEACISGVKNA